MNTTPDPAPEQRLADLVDALRALGREPTDAEAAALAQRHGVAAADVAACRRAVAALANCLEPAVPAADPAILPDTYEVLGELGRGGMGVVFRARHRALGREVAIKVLQPGESSFQELLRRFETEAKSLARLRHPHIVAVHDVGRSGGHVWYTMDLIDGTSLDKVLKQGAMPPSRAVRILTEVASAIEHSHAHGVIHRDLKPANILLDTNDVAFVADFGLARDRNVSVELTTTGQIMGTPAYMSPEAMRGDSALVGERTDVWALGAMLYEALTGVSPFRRDNFADTMHAVLREDPVPLRKRNARVPRDLELVCHKALAKGPDERYATARAFREDLERFQQGLPVLAQRPDLRRRAARWFARNRAAVLGAAVSSVLVAIVATFFAPTARTPDAIDATIREAGKRAEKGDHAGALQLYELSRDVLGSDAQRSLRHGNGVLSSPLVWHVWRGILDCRAELAWQRVAKGENAAAAADFAQAMRECPRESLHVRFDGYAGDLAALQAMAGDHAAAADTLRVGIADESAKPHADTGASVPTLFVWISAVSRLRSIWRDPRHAQWRDAGRLLAVAVACETERPFDLRLAEFSPVTALTAAWTSADALAPAARERLRSLLREAAFGGGTPLQWGAPDASLVRGLADLVDDKTLPSAVRGEALDVLCAIADLPWRPTDATKHLAVDGGRGVEAKGIALRQLELPRDEALRARITFAVDLLRAGDAGAVDVKAWLAARTGEDAAADFATWWREHRGEPPVTMLGRSLGKRAIDATGEALHGRFAALTGVDRERYHHWLSLQAAAEARTPLWPSGEAEPANLVASWAVGLRDEKERYFFRLADEGLRADGTGFSSGYTMSGAIEVGKPMRTWFRKVVGSLSARVSPWAALSEAPARFFVSLPGATDVLRRESSPEQRVEVCARLSMADRPAFHWGVEYSNPPWSDRWQLDEVGPEAFDTFGVRVTDGVFGGWDGEVAGPQVFAFLAGKSWALPGDGGAAWKDAVVAAATTLRDLAANDDEAGFVTALTDGGATARRFEVLARIPAGRVAADLLPMLQQIDTFARTAAAREGVDAGQRERLAAPLAGRLQADDASALAEPGFADRLAAAERGLALGPWWWYRVFASATDEALRSLAAERLAVAELPESLLLQMDRGAHRERLPASALQAIERLLAQRSSSRTKVFVALGTLVGVLASAGLVALWSALRRHGSRRWLVPAASLLVLTSLVVVVVDCRFGVWRLPPVSLGLAGLAVASIALLRVRTDRLALIAAFAAVVAFVGGLAAENGWHPFASAIDSMVTALAAGLLALQFARVASRGRGFGWFPALPLFAAAAGGAAVGLDVLLRDRDVEDFTSAVAQTPWASWLMGTAWVGVVAFAVLVIVVGIAGLRRPVPTVA